MNSNDNNNNNGSKIIIKAVCKQDIRKLYLVLPPKFNWFKKSIVSAFGLEEKNIKMTYVDEEGDNVTLANLNDLNIALESLPQGKCLRVMVKVFKAKVEKKEEEEEEKESEVKANDELKDKVIPVKKLQKPLVKLEKFQPEEEAPESSPSKPEEKVVPLLKLQKPKPQPKAKENKAKAKEGEVIPLLKLQKPKPQPKETKAKEEVVPLLKLQKPKPQPKETKAKEGEVVPLLKLQKPKPQPKAKEGEVIPLLKLQKPKPQPKAKENKEEVVPLLKLQKPKPQPKEVNPKEGEVIPLLKLHRPVVIPQESNDVPVSSETSTTPSQETKIPIVYSGSSTVVEQPQTPQPEEEFLYKSSLNDLVVMGFPDNTYLRSLLISNKGNVEVTITQLLN